LTDEKETPMRFEDEAAAITYVFRSLAAARAADPTIERQPDEITRDVTPTRELLREADLLAHPREYAVITGSKGKGSTTAITAKLLRHLGHTVGMISSPHMVSYRERIRVNGRAIPESELLRILSDLAPFIDRVEAALPAKRYFSPQGIFLAVGLRWFDEMGVDVAVLEVGRGGRFDDIAVVPNKLSLFTPIMIEHPYQLGATLERIAWHKAGIIKSYSYVYSVPQATEVLSVIQSESDALDAEFAWIAPTDMGEYLGRTDRGLMMRLGRYGDVELSLTGKYQVENATLAVQGAGNLHGRLAGIAHGSPEYVDSIRAGLGDVTWAGRLQKLAADPAIYIDGATTMIAAQSFIESLEGALTQPLVSIIATPEDRDYDGVYRTMSRVSDHVILTDNTINPKVRFPERAAALATAQKYHAHVEYADDLMHAIERARTLSGAAGTILIAAAQPVVGEALLLWGLTYEEI